MRFHNRLCVPVSLGLSVSVLSLPSTSLGPRLTTQPHPHLRPRAGAGQSHLSRNPRTRDCPHGLVRASLPPRMGYLCGVPRHRGAAPRSPRSPRATGVPSWLELRRVQPVPALGSRSAPRSRAGFVPRAQASSARQAAPPPAVGRLPGIRAHVHTPFLEERAGPRPVRSHQASTPRPGYKRRKAAP